MKQTQGACAIGDRFWNRTTELELFGQKLDDGTHLLLVAQRRMGKTSLMREAAQRMGDIYLPLYVDLQQATSAPDAIVALTVATRPHTSLWATTKTLFDNAMKFVDKKIEKLSLSELSISMRAGLTEGNWAAKGDKLLASLAASKKPVVLLLDEVPIMVNRMLKGQDYTITPERKHAVDEFMSWLRKNSLEHQGKIRIVLTGSIGFEPVLRQAGLSAQLNTFTPFDLRPWSADTARGCLQALAEEYEISFPDRADRAMVECLQCCIPDHVQMFFGHVRDWCMRNNVTEFLRAQVEEVYKEEMLGVRGHAELSHYEERLRTVLGVEPFALAIDMLTEAAMNPGLTRDAMKALQSEYTFEGVSTMEMQKELIFVLEHDGYLNQTDDGYFFVSALLRDWWKRRHGSFFTPALERGGHA